MSEPVPTESSGNTGALDCRHGKPIIFVIVTLIADGFISRIHYSGFGFPVHRFPSCRHRRDNGVAPIDQMLVTITRPIEEAVNSVQGLER